MVRRMLFLSALSVCLLQGSLQQVPGTLDPTFGGNGTGFNRVAFGDQTNALVLTCQNKAILGGRIIRMGAGIATVVGFNSNGTLDLTFGGNGTGLNEVAVGVGSSVINSLVIDSKGRILTCGNDDDDAFVMRFHSDGTLDTTFGDSNGYTLVDFGGISDRLFDVILDSEERIIASGTSTDGVTEDVAIVRFLQDGLLDTTFGGNGTGFNTVDIGGDSDQGTGLVMDSKGRFVVGGSTVTGPTKDAFVMRFNSDGTLDTTFGASNGYTEVGQVFDTESIISVILDSQERILATGGLITPAPTFSPIVIRFTQNGLLDPTFGENSGFTVIPTTVGALGDDLLLDLQGRIVVIGSATISRLTSDGFLDRTFGANGTGITVTQVTPFPALSGIQLDTSGKLVVALQLEVDPRVGIARYYNQSLTELTTGIREKYCF
jgi:uncharacterized delta-60 repeat protein